MIDVIISPKLKKQIIKIQRRMTPGDTELSGPLFGYFDILEGREVMILTKFFDRTISSSHVDTKFEFHSNFFIRREIKEGRNNVGSLHTHPFMDTLPSETDKMTGKEIFKKLSIRQTAYIIVNDKDIYIWREDHETNKSKNTK